MAMSCKGSSTLLSSRLTNQLQGIKSLSRRYRRTTTITTGKYRLASTKVYRHVEYAIARQKPRENLYEGRTLRDDCRPEQRSPLLSASAKLKFQPKLPYHEIVFSFRFTTAGSIIVMSVPIFVAVYVALDAEHFY